VAEIAFVKIKGADDFRRLRQQLKAAGRGDLQRSLLRQIRRIGGPALAAAKTGAMRVDVQSSRGGGSSSGLRASVAQATTIRIVSGGISIRVEPRRMDNKHRPWGLQLSLGLDRIGRWRHPVFGRLDQPWVEQYGTEFFYTSLKRYEGPWRRGVEQAMEETARKLEG
jgi:hypothetical protein